MPLAKPHASVPGQPEYTQEPQRRTQVSSKVRDAPRRASRCFSILSDKSLQNLRLRWSKDGRRKEDKPQAVQSKEHRPGRLPPVLEKQDEPIRAHREPSSIRNDHSKRLFHDKLDLCAETEIINDCEALNNKINEAALSLVEEWCKAPTLSHKRRRFTGDSVSLSSHDQKYLKDVLGVKLFASIRHLRSSTPSEDLQNRITDALQALAVSVSFYIISQTFCPGLSHTANVEMQQTFKHMLSQQPQATALRWRALTYEHSSWDTTVQTFTADNITHLAHFYSAIFILAGERDSSALLSRMRQFVLENDIVESALQLARKLKTSFFSVHLDVSMVKPGNVFREDAMDRLDADENNDTSERRLVSCTLELGIREILYPAQEGRGRILLKPKVVFVVSDVVLIYLGPF